LNYVVCRIKAAGLVAYLDYSMNEDLQQSWQKAMLIV